jgi:hypothetical protein
MKKVSVSLIKKSIRDTQRLYKHSPSPALETKLADLKEKLSDLQSEARKIKVQQKYKYVKFVEKKKLLRKLKSLDASDDLMQVQLHMAYIDHYPRDLKYISILMDTSEEGQELRNSILLYLQKVKDETGKWPVDWEYAEKVQCKTKLPKPLNDDFFI